VVFLDGLPEFGQNGLEEEAQPLEDALIPSARESQDAVKRDT
jgi:hypothetical protein